MLTILLILIKILSTTEIQPNFLDYLLAKHLQVAIMESPVLYTGSTKGWNVAVNTFSP